MSTSKRKCEAFLLRFFSFAVSRYFFIMKCNIRCVTLLTLFFYGLPIIFDCIWFYECKSSTKNSASLLNIKKGEKRERKKHPNVKWLDEFHWCDFYYMLCWNLFAICVLLSLLLLSFLLFISLIIEKSIYFDGHYWHSWRKQFLFFSV